MNNELMEFINSQKLMTIATSGEDGAWTNNVYYTADSELNLFFVSPKDTKHSENIANNKQVAFNIAWYDESNLGNRKAVQGIGVCKEIKDIKKVTKYLKLHHSKYPIWKNRITYLNMKNKIIGSRPYIIKPTYIKFWNDDAFGSDGIKEYRL